MSRRLVSLALGLVTLVNPFNHVRAADLADSAVTAESLEARSRAVLAQLDGELALPRLERPVDVLRDPWGVPHIYAQTQHDLFYAQGVVAAQDRLFQIDIWRRTAAGELAEAIGDRVIDNDRMARLFKYRGDMDAEWTSYSHDTRTIAAAFTDGINDYVDSLGDRLPIEFQILGIRPSRWKPEDVLGRMSGIVMIRNLPQEVTHAELAAAVGIERARQILPADPAFDYEVPAGLDLADVDRKLLSFYDRTVGDVVFEASDFGSNNWVVDGTLSASGKPLLANDPHRRIELPSLRYLVHLNGPGWNVIGSGEPALPGVAIGHNERIAWGLTIVGTDQADIYVEELHPDDDNRYRVGDAWAPIEVVRESIRVAHRDEPAELELRFTRHGPIIHEDRERRRAFAVRWVGAEPGTAGYLGSLAIDRAANWDEFLAAVRAWKLPSENLVYADVDGNIGWIAAAQTPVRNNHRGLFPVPGADSQYEWKRFLSVDELPQEFNPPRHFIGTANANILPDGYAHDIAFEWSTPYRQRRVRDVLASKSSFATSDFERLQHDNTTLPGQAIVRLLSEVEIDDAELAPYVALMRSWDGVLSRESRAGPLYAVWMRELLDGFFKPHVPSDMLGRIAVARGVEVMLPALESPSAEWFAGDPRVACDALIRDTFAAAVAKTKARISQIEPASAAPSGDSSTEAAAAEHASAPSDIEAWSWGELHRAAFRHPLAAFDDVYAKSFNLQSVPRAGDAFTPNAATHNDSFQQTSGASFREIIDSADWDRMLVTSVPGQSAQPFSPHYADLLPLWAEGEYFPLKYTRPAVEEVTAHRLRLAPPAK